MEQMDKIHEALERIYEQVVCKRPEALQVHIGWWRMPRMGGTVMNKCNCGMYKDSCYVCEVVPLQQQIERMKDLLIEALEALRYDVNCDELIELIEDELGEQ